MSEDVVPGGAEGKKDEPDAAAHGTEGDSSKSDEDVTEGKSVTYILNEFHERVYAPGSAFGMSNQSEASAATGPLDAELISTTIRSYVRPAPYAAARAALVKRQAVVLYGALGLGKRTGAIVLLRQVLPADAPIVSLAPSVTLEELADKRDFRKGHGYVVFNRFRVDRDREIDHRWNVVRTRVCKAGAYLVVTTREWDGYAPEAVQHIAWECPDQAEVLRARLGEAATEEIIAQIGSLLPEEYRMGDLVEVARRVARGASVPDAVAEVLRQAEHEDVEEWFSRDLTRDQVLDITTLAFVTDVNIRDFETCRAGLDALLPARPEPPPVDPAQPGPEAPFVPPRADRLLKHPLIGRKQVEIDGVPRRLLVFKEPGYRRHVLERLFDAYPIEFWDAVRDWLHVTVADRGLQPTVASGLALLSHSAFEEIEASYLRPWADAKAGVAGRYAAAWTLSFMCLDENLSPIALRTVNRWAAQGSSEARLTAIIAFTADLGVRYPSEAPKRLWQLVKQENNLSEVAAAAFGWLFARLVDQEGGGRQVVNHLSGQLAEAPERRRRGALYRASLVAARSVVTARNPRTGRPAIMEYLRDRPAEIPAVAVMWAALLRHWPLRHEALNELHAGLRALEPMTPDAQELARALGDALGEALSEKEKTQVAADFAKRVRNAAGRGRSPKLAEILIKAMEGAHRKRREEYP
ncbi:hypothetical protein [Actinocorallia aurantiaca]|uniref:Uncharacterized protein n=1 Tax=Actinocorallia aurantiaca TaxID=46204 RepID=A0ABP6GAM5_9ACTN